MNPLLLGPLLEFGKDLIDRFIPDASEKARAEANMLQAIATGEMAKVMKQLEINAQEAAHPSIWVAGWRPYYGWVGGTGFGYAVLLQPLLAWVARVKGWPEPPVIDTDLLLVVVGGLLGIGGLRTYEKKSGVTK